MQLLEQAQQVFVAYPNSPSMIDESINGAAELADSSKISLRTWRKMGVEGLKLDDLIRDFIDHCHALIADISVPNFNVYYEIGFALARAKPVVLIVNSGLNKSIANVNLTGLFDNIGWIEYSNARELIERLYDWEKVSWIEKYEKPKDHSQPLFILDTLKKIEFTQSIFQSVVHRSVNYRSFDPMEIPRLAASRAITEISASAGCILPLLSSDIVDHQINNLRAAFLAGLSHGYEIEPLLIQYGNGPAPADYRDFVTNSASRTETNRHVEEYCSKVLVRNQINNDRSQRFKLGLLNKIDLGQSAAENESLSLPRYFIPTAEFSRSVRSDHALIVGRKGSGKTAIFYQVRNQCLKERDDVVIELRPATHNLSELRFNLLEIVNQGIFDHTIAAFWQYIVYIEILIKIREKVIPYGRREFKVQQRIAELERDIHLDDIIVSGDFTSRLDGAVKDILKLLKDDKTVSFSGIRTITNVVYEEAIPKLRDHVVEFSEFFDDIVLLIDDLDKGWPPKQLEPHDVLMIRHLIEVLRRIERDLRRKDIKFKSLMFLRSDVYENLVENTSDRGKYNPIVVDWSDRAQLTHLLKERVGSNFPSDEKEEAWAAINVVMPDGHFAVEKLVDASLFRPRFLIEACEKVLSTAINRGDAFVTAGAVEHGLRQMSQYLVSDFGYELRDVSGIPENIFYRFIGKNEHLTAKEIDKILNKSIDGKSVFDVIELLLWYGFLGIVTQNGDSQYIFDCGYDFRRLLAFRNDDPDEVLYCVNKAFLRGLELS